MPFSQELVELLKFTHIIKLQITCYFPFFFFNYLKACAKITIEGAGLSYDNENLLWKTALGYQQWLFNSDPAYLV